MISFNEDQVKTLSHNTEALAVSLFPFLNSPSATNNIADLQSLRSSFVPGSKGIVIPVGEKNFRYACHLIANLRRILKSTLPIQIAYAGDSDLPFEYRQHLTSMDAQISAFDVTTVFDDKTLDLLHGGWAIKSFALLGSTFEEALVLDADAIFLQEPREIFDQDPRYKATGTLLFHDRLIWQGAFKDRHEWWEKELAHTDLSPSIRNSKVYMDGYAEEGDSGVVAVDKSRVEVFTGLLHICWQNTAAVREESWWFGFELSAVPYSMEEHYATVLGQKEIDDRSEKVCSFDIAHVDHTGRLLWYNGSLLKNKKLNLTEFEIPTVWMIDGTWEKSSDRSQPSCMRDAEIRSLTPAEAELLGKTVEAAKSVDEDLVSRFPGILAPP
jgi:alpha 1,3-mannosyltransferase